MRYLVTLKPLEPFLFGGDTTFGRRDDDKNSSYLVKSRQFPQQSAVLGMLKKEIMIQAGVLTKKVRGEWVDKNNKIKAKELVGNEKFDVFATMPQNFGVIKEIGAIFLLKNTQRYIKKVAINKFSYSNGLLKGYNPKEDIYDNFICIEDGSAIKSNNIFQEVEQIGNAKQDSEKSLFKKTSYLLQDDFKFAFYLECDYELQNSIISLGADKSSFKLEVKEDGSVLDYQDENGYLTLLSDSYITLPIKEKEYCDFAITSEISYKQLLNNFDDNKRAFAKSKKLYFYEKGSIIINPSKELIENLSNQNLQKIGYNKYTIKGQN